MPVQVFMMHFVCPTDRSYIFTITPGKPLKALVNNHVMDDKIRRDAKMMAGNKKVKYAPEVE